MFTLAARACGRGVPVMMNHSRERSKVRCLFPRLWARAEKFCL